jgi:hypothetical protein
LQRGGELDPGVGGPPRDRGPRHHR